jgi:NADH-quinone oxidoreductase subunit H
VVGDLGSLDPVLGTSTDERDPLGWTLAFALSAVTLGVAMTIVAYMTWLERKVAARMQNRIGPYEVGVPHGFLQPLADVAKLLVKEDITPRAADAILFNLGPVLVVVPALVGFAFIPLAPAWRSSTTRTRSCSSSRSRR